MFSETEVKEALSFLEVAKKDLEAAKLLLENRYYPQGLFYLQQSIEKAAKAILRALDLADFETLRKEVGHEILLKGLRKIGYELLGKLKNCFFRMFVDDLVTFCELASLCPEAFMYVNEMIKSISKEAEDFQEWLDKEYSKGVSKAINRLSNVIFQEDEEATNVLNEIIDQASVYIVNITETIKELGVESIIILYWWFESSVRKHVKKNAKDRDSLARALFGLKNYGTEFKDLMARKFYLLGAYLLLLSYHTLFEGRTSALRYPDKNWTPLSISENSVIVKESEKIIDFMQRQELLDVLEDFIKGKMVHSKSKEVYATLTDYIESLKNMTIKNN